MVDNEWFSCKKVVFKEVEEMFRVFKKFFKEVGGLKHHKY